MVHLDIHRQIFITLIENLIYTLAPSFYFFCCLPGMREDVVDLQEKGVPNLGMCNYYYATQNDVLDVMSNAWPRWNKMEITDVVKGDHQHEDNTKIQTALNFLVIYPRTEPFEMRYDHWIN